MTITVDAPVAAPSTRRQPPTNTAREVLTAARLPAYGDLPDPASRLGPRTFAPGVVQIIRPGEIHDVRNERACWLARLHGVQHRVRGSRRH